MFYFNTIDRNKAFLLKTCFNFDCIDLELMPHTGVFLYPRDIRSTSKNPSGTAMVRHLMSVFYTNKELIDRGNVMGVNGKEGLNKEIVKAIIGNVFILK